MNTNAANARYQARSEQIKLNLEILKKLLKEDAKEQKKNKGDWGFVGSLGEAAIKLEHAVMHLGGNPVKIMELANTLLYPVKPKGADSQYVTVPKE